MADREPIDRSGRRTGEMPADPTPRSTTPHSTHDLVLLAAVADHDPDPATRAVVERMIASCPECAAIAEDLRVLALGLADLPTSLPAPRDMRLSEVDATRLRRGGLWRAILRPFGAAGIPSLRPLAGVLTTLGIAGILLTTVPLGFGSAGAALSQVGSAVHNDFAAPSANPPKAVYPSAASVTTEAGGPAGQATSAPPYLVGPSVPQPSSGDASLGGVPSGTAGQPTAAELAPNVDRTSSSASIPPLTLISIVLLLAGVGLFWLRLIARRID